MVAKNHIPRLPYNVLVYLPELTTVIYNTNVYMVAKNHIPRLLYNVLVYLPELTTVITLMFIW